MNAGASYLGRPFPDPLNPLRPLNPLGFSVGEMASTGGGDRSSRRPNTRQI